MKEALRSEKMRLSCECIGLEGKSTEDAAFVKEFFCLNHGGMETVHSNRCLYGYMCDPEGLSPTESAQWLMFWSS